MDPAKLENDSGDRRQSLVVKISDTLRRRIGESVYKVGDRLPSEAQLGKQFSVSRTVVREAIASLRSDGLVEPRQGAGVFVRNKPASDGLFRNLDFARLSSAIEMLELRMAVEGDAAALAALRRSPAQEERVVEAFDLFRTRVSQGGPTADEDFAFHLAIAEAANNARFCDFLSMLGPGIIPRRAVTAGSEARLPSTDLARLVDEHAAILAAIRHGDEDGARAAMRRHLKNSLERYRGLMSGTR